MPQCIILEIPDTLSQWYHIRFWVFLEIQVKNCILGMLLICLIDLQNYSALVPPLSIPRRKSSADQPVWQAGNVHPAFCYRLPLCEAVWIFKSVFRILHRHIHTGMVPKGCKYFRPWWPVKSSFASGRSHDDGPTQTWLHFELNSTIHCIYSFTFLQIYIFLSTFRVWMIL